MGHPSIPFAKRDPAFIRISELPSMGRCPGFMLAQAHRNRMTKAADTGSCVGRMIQLFHEMGEDPIALEAATRQTRHEHPQEFPQADLEEAIRVGSLYALDRRNHGVVVKGSTELEVWLTLEPAAEDPTGKPILLRGHLDQIRAEGSGRWKIWDTKNGDLDGDSLLYGYAWQIAAYALAASEHYQRAVLPGGVIRLKGYGAKCKPEEAHEARIFYGCAWTLDTCRDMMRTVAQHVAWLRSGIIHLHPGAHCVWCPSDGPHACGDFIADAYPKGVNL